jgi:3-dehydro-L-gulonate 2-dehydrogenase
VLSGGKTTKQLSEGKYETGLSQVFIAIDPMSVNSRDYQSVIDETIAYYTSAERIDPEEPIIFPGERVKKISEENLRFGIPVEVGIWERVHSLL